jgi:ATP-dependent Clp protease adaptor protein ClpS
MTPFRAAARDNVPVSRTIEAPTETEAPQVFEERQEDPPWVVLVWNDPINLMSYVALIFRRLFGYSEAKATQLMLQVHEEGKAVVASGTRERCEFDVARLHAHGLWATMRQD